MLAVFASNLMDLLRFLLILSRMHLILDLDCWKRGLPHLTHQQLHQSTATSMWWCSPRPHSSWVKMAVGLPKSSRYPEHSPSCGRSGRNCLLSPPILSGYNGSPDTHFSKGTMQLMSWPDRKRYLCPLQSLVVSLLLSIISTLLFSRTGGILSHLNSLAHRFP